MFIRIKDCNKKEMIVNTEQVTTITRYGDELRVNMNDGKYFYIDSACEKMLFGIIGVTL